MREFEYHGSKIRLNDDGTMTVIRPDGSRIESNTAGGMQMTLSEIKSIGISNIVDVKNYMLTEKEGLIIHTIEFHGDGVLCLAYDKNGKVENLGSRGLRLEISKDNNLVYHRK